MVTRKTERRGIKSIDTSFDIIEEIMDSGEPTLSEIAEELEMSPSTVHEHIRTLKERGILVDDDTGYRLGLKCLEYGVQARKSRLVSKVSEPLLVELAEKTNEMVSLLVEERGYGVVLKREMGERAIEPIGKIGGHYHLHYIASGKAILANLPDNRIQEIIDERGLPKQTRHTITSEEELWNEIEEIRQENIAFERQEGANGVRAVGVPIICNDEVRAAIDVAGPANRMRMDKMRDEIAELLLGATNEIELLLTYENSR